VVNLTKISIFTVVDITSNSYLQHAIQTLMTDLLFDTHARYSGLSMIKIPQFEITFRLETNDSFRLWNE
jgi:hypothetical protein